MMADHEIDLGIVPESTPHIRSRKPAAAPAPVSEPTPDVRSPVFAAPDAAANMAPDALPAATPDVRSQESTQLTICLDSLGIGAMTASEFLDIGIDEMNRSFAHAVRAGAAFWATQETLRETADDPATFKSWLHDRGLSEQRVYELISMAKFYARLPAGQREQVTKIGKSKALLLAGVPQQLMDEAVKSGRDVIGDADMMTVVELKEEVKALKKREANYDAELERRDWLIGKLQKSRALVTDFTAATEDTRAECMFLQGTCEASINSLLRMYEAATSAHVDVPERELQIDQIWITLHALVARGLDVIARIRDEDIQPLPDRVLGPHALTPAEAERWLIEWRTLEGRTQAEAAVRQQLRDDARPRGPGRPKKAQG